MLDISQNLALVELSCGGNQLTMLDISQNATLKVLFCSYNLFIDRSAIIGLDESKLMNFDFDPQDLQISQS